MEKLSAQLTGKSCNVHIKRKVFGTIFSALLATATFGQGVGINTTTPDPSAALDIQATDKGVLIPKVSLQSVSDNNAVPAPANGLLVYNTNAAFESGIGFYYNINTPAAPDWRSVGELRLPINKSASLPSGATAFRLNDFGSSGSATIIHAFSQNGYALNAEGKVRIAGSQHIPGVGKVLTSDASGNASWDGGIAFRAENILFDGAHILAPHTDYKVPYEIKNYDRTNSYSLHGFPSEDTFVAPISGIYHFDFQVSWAKGNRMSVGLFVQTNNVLKTLCRRMGDLPEMTFAGSADVLLQPGDQVYVAVSHIEESNVSLKNPSHFSGHFVQSAK